MDCILKYWYTAAILYSIPALQVQYIYSGKFSLSLSLSLAVFVSLWLSLSLSLSDQHVINQDCFALHCLLHFGFLFVLYHPGYVWMHHTYYCYAAKNTEWFKMCDKRRGASVQISLDIGTLTWYCTLTGMPCYTSISFFKKLAGV